MWRKLLFTSLYGTYLGESGSRDAFELLVQSMRLRASRRRPEPEPPAAAEEVALQNSMLRAEERETSDIGAVSSSSYRGWA